MNTEVYKRLLDADQDYVLGKARPYLDELEMMHDPQAIRFDVKRKRVSSLIRKMLNDSGYEELAKNISIKGGSRA